MTTQHYSAVKQKMNIVLISSTMTMDTSRTVCRMTATTPSHWRHPAAVGTITVVSFRDTPTEGHHLPVLMVTTIIPTTTI